MSTQKSMSSAAALVEHPELHPLIQDPEVRAAAQKLGRRYLVVKFEQARRLAEAQAGDRFSELQLAHAERLAAERVKLERYYRQQEAAVGQIAIENTRLAKQRELLERRHADLAALERRQTLVPELALLGLAVVA